MSNKFSHAKRPYKSPPVCKPPPPPPPPPIPHCSSGCTLEANPATYNPGGRVELSACVSSAAAEPDQDVDWELDGTCGSWNDNGLIANDGQLHWITGWRDTLCVGPVNMTLTIKRLGTVICTAHFTINPT